MLERVLEPEVMDTAEEARAYDAMDHGAVNSQFVLDLLAARGEERGGSYLDLGTGPGRIAIMVAQADHRGTVVGVDLAWEMLEVARAHLSRSGLAGQVRFERADAKNLPYADGSFDVVMSNSILHHLPEPERAAAEMVRLLARGGLLFCRDLCRPADRDALERLVVSYAGEESPEAQAMFAASLQAALTVDEVKSIAESLGVGDSLIRMSSDRHWTWVWRRPDAPKTGAAGSRA